MVKTKDPAWSHFKPSNDESKPWQDLYEGELHKGNITKMKLWLCFDSKLFRQQHATARLALLCTLTEGNMVGRAPKLKDEVAAAKAARARALEQPAGGSGPNNAGSAGAGADTSLAQRYGAIATSVAVSGFSAAQMAMEATGQTFIDRSHGQVHEGRSGSDQTAASSVDVCQSAAAQRVRWARVCRLPQGAVPGAGWQASITLCHSVHPSSHFYVSDGAHCYRHENTVAVTYNEVKAAVDEVKSQVERISVWVGLARAYRLMTWLLTSA